MITENLPILQIHRLTQEQYDRESALGNIDKNAIYLTPYEEIVIDQIYNPESVNAQSGIAIAQALGNIETVLDSIIAMQNSLIGGDSE